jgi:hypothetical protein
MERPRKHPVEIPEEVSQESDGGDWFYLNPGSDGTLGDYQPQAKKPGSSADMLRAAIAEGLKMLSEGDMIADMEALRKLISRHGKDRLKRLIDALG